MGARGSSSLSANISAELYNIYRQMEMYQPFLLRDVDVANVCANFVVTGVKQDNDTKLKMPHLPKSEKHAYPEMKMRENCKVSLGITFIHLSSRSLGGYLIQSFNGLMIMELSCMPTLLVGSQQGNYSGRDRILTLMFGTLFLFVLSMVRG